jgi:site-specific recombinase XerD
MIPRNFKNERIKRQYADFLKHADGKAEQTIRQIEKSIQRYEAYTSYADFGAFDQQKAKGFKADLGSRELSKATILSTVVALKRFLGWLAIQPGHKSKISLTEFLSLSEKDIRAAKAPAVRAIPTLEQVLQVVENMPTESAIEKRNRALIAFIAITGPAMVRS